MSKVRVRFAPSPTGYLHVGGARTALFNWLFARHGNGCFILRIEDTDVERSSAELETIMLDDLAWLGLTWDEGPRIGGEYGPYRQSERIGIYRERADRLVSEDKAYFCFCTDEELEHRKAIRLKAGLTPQYDGQCRSLSDAEREERRSRGLPESIRFIVPDDGERRIDDIIRREVVFPAGMVGDFVIIRSSGIPTYNFAAAVDDALMGITHVIRGEEHLSNTLRQLMVYEALDLDRPRFAHLPLILGPDRSKLSKRHGAPNIIDFHDRGYPPEAIVNYLAFLGWSPPEAREIFSIEELISVFTLDRVSQSPSIFDEVKLNWVSEHHIRAGGSARYFDLAYPHFDEEFRTVYSKAALMEILDVVSENLSSFSRIGEEAASFRPGPPYLDAEARGMLEGRAALLTAFASGFETCNDWNKGELAGVIKSVSKELGVRGKDLYMPLRAAITGSLHGPDVLSIVRIRGREDVLESLRHAVRKENE